MPPVQQGRELDSLDTAGNSETEKQPVEMSFHGTPRHVELRGYLGVVASLQQQVDDLLFARTEPHSLLLHPILLFLSFSAPIRCRATTISISGSIHDAILKLLRFFQRKTFFHSDLQAAALAPEIGTAFSEFGRRHSGAGRCAEKRGKTHIQNDL